MSGRVKSLEETVDSICGKIEEYRRSAALEEQLRRVIQAGDDLLLTHAFEASPSKDAWMKLRREIVGEYRFEVER